MSFTIAYKDKKLTIGVNIFRFTALIFLAAIMHVIVLKFIFPGYYSPLFPNHEDFYIPIAFAHAPGDYYSFGSLMTWTRPVFMIFLKSIGYFGIQGSIAVIIAIVIINCALTGLLVKRLLNLSFSWIFGIAFAVYCYLLFATPYFYIFYTEDVGSHLSYFFLLLGAYSFYSTLNKPITLSALLLLCCCTLAFLSKETYQLVALFFSFLWFLYYRKVSLKRSLVPIITTLIALFISIANNIRVSSVFVNPKATKGSPYEINLNPGSVLNEMYRYAREGLNISDVVLLLLIGFLVFKYFKLKGDKSRGLLILIIGCMLAPVLSWVPNSLLPNHHFEGYSFNGLYLFYLPLLFLPFLWTHKSVNTTGIVIVGLLSLGSYFMNIKRYNDSHNNWVLLQETTQRNLYLALDSLISRLTPYEQPQKVLVEGITFPFHPFRYPESLRVFPNAGYATYDIVNYNPSHTFGERRDLVRFINPSDTSLFDYQETWIFNSEGKLIGKKTNTIHNGLSKKPGDSTRVQVTLDNLLQFKTSGFYTPEPGIVWTDGKINIELNTPIKNKDSLTARLNTYMPPACKNITPRLTLIDTDSIKHEPIGFKREGDIFLYRFVLKKRISIQRVNILSPTIDSGPTDRRVLSFPFISLDIR